MIKLNEKESKRLEEALDKPKAPNEALKKAMEKFKK
jgi:uncharacterized protein (DUF1778 family)